MVFGLLKLVQSFLLLELAAAQETAGCVITEGSRKPRVKFRLPAAVCRLQRTALGFP